MPGLSAAVAPVRLLRRVAQRLARGVGGLLGRAVLRSEGVELGGGVRVWGVPVVSRAPGSRIVVGSQVVLCSRSADTALGVSHAVVLRTLEPGARLEIGEDSGLSGTTVCAAVAVRIGRRCLLGADTLVVDTDFHPLAPQGRRHGADPAATGRAAVTIGDDVFVGARACILKGVTVGDGAVIGCAAVVTRDVPAGAIVAGNPARVVGRVPGAPDGGPTTGAPAADMAAGTTPGSVP